jgi:hypothetical protein
VGRLVINLINQMRGFRLISEAIVRFNLFGLFGKTRVVKSDLIDLDKTELSEFKLT